MSRALPTLVGIGLLGALCSPAHADGACVLIDGTRDNLAPGDQHAVRIAIATALEAEGVPVDHQGMRCSTSVVAHTLVLGRTVTTTLEADGKTVSGKASNLDEVDLLVRQLVRSLVTGRSLATGSGVTDRSNVLRDQTAPRRIDAASSRRWTPVLGVGGGMLQLPATATRARQRQHNIVAIDLREWGFLTSNHSALELRVRLLLHDYAVFGTAYDGYRASRDEPDNQREDVGRAFGLMFSPLAVANWEFGVGFVSMLGDRAPRPYVRVGGASALLCRFSDPDHRADLGIGFYAGLGFQLTDNASISVEFNVMRPVIHDLLDRGYGYFLTTTAMVEFHGRPGPRNRSSGLLGNPIPTIHRVNE